jgi:hypothetical protein
MKGVPYNLPQSIQVIPYTLSGFFKITKIQIMLFQKRCTGLLLYLPANKFPE